MMMDIGRWYCQFAEEYEFYHTFVEETRKKKGDTRDKMISLWQRHGEWHGDW